MTIEEQDFIIDTLIELKDVINNKNINKLIKEVHENNIMLKQIIKVINTYIARHHNENADDFSRNVLANLISNGLDFK